MSHEIVDKTKKWLLIKKSTNFVPPLQNLVKITTKKSEYIIMLEYQHDWIKIVDFSKAAYFWSCLFCGTPFMFFSTNGEFAIPILCRKLKPHTLNHLIISDLCSLWGCSIGRSNTRFAVSFGKTEVKHL